MIQATCLSAGDSDTYIDDVNISRTSNCIIADYSYELNCFTSVGSDLIS